MNTYVNEKKVIAETFSLVIRRAKLFLLVANAAEVKPSQVDRCLREANETVFGGLLDCIAYEVHKEEVGWGNIFVPEIQDRFAQLSSVLDNHLSAGFEAADRRRALLERIGPYCGRIKNGDLIGGADGEAVADAANEVEGRRRLYKFLFFGSKACDGEGPNYTGGPDEEFTPEQACKLVKTLEGLRVGLNDHIGEFKRIFAESQLNQVFANHHMMVGEIHHVSQRLKVKSKPETVSLSPNSNSREVA